MLIHRNRDDKPDNNAIFAVKPGNSFKAVAELEEIGDPAAELAN